MMMPKRVDIIMRFYFVVKITSSHVLLTAPSPSFLGACNYAHLAWYIILYYICIYNIQGQLGTSDLGTRTIPEMLGGQVHVVFTAARSKRCIRSISSWTQDIFLFFQIQILNLGPLYDEQNFRAGANNVIWIYSQKNILKDDIILFFTLNRGDAGEASDRLLKRG